MTSNVDFDRERAWWDAKAHKEERDGHDEPINRALRWREMERRLDGVETILEVGAGTGAFSIPLAERGYEVTHLDLSPLMIEAARAKAGSLRSLRFVEGNATDLSRFADRFFDLVLNMDGAISFCGDQAERALFECCRVARKRIMVTVSHRAWMVPIWVGTSIHVTGRILPAANVMFDAGTWYQDQFPDNPLLTEENTSGYFGPLRAFLPAELRDLLQRAGLHVVRCGGLGSLANLVGPDVVRQVLADAALTQEFVELCDRYDAEISPEGIGTTERAGLIAVAERPEG
jgi:SAM-dependent methyltransferase